MQKIQTPSSTEDELRQAFTVNAIIFFTIFCIVNGLMDDEFKEHHKNLVVLFSVLRILLGFGVILPEKTREILMKSTRGKVLP